MTFVTATRRNGKRDIAWIGCVAAAGLALSVFFIIGAGRPPRLPAPADRIAAAAGISCPASIVYADPDSMQATIDEDLRQVAAILQTHGLEPARAGLQDVQTEICALIRQNPQRGLSWLQLLSASPEAVADGQVRQSLLTLSQDLSRLEIDSVRARVSFAAPRWMLLSPEERRILLADARTLAQVPVGNAYVVQLALLGASGGVELTTQLRAIVAQHHPQFVRSFDAYLQIATRRAR